MVAGACLVAFTKGHHEHQPCPAIRLLSPERALPATQLAWRETYTQYRVHARGSVRVHSGDVNFANEQCEQVKTTVR
jgi:hypothetical protein